MLTDTERLTQAAYALRHMMGTHIIDLPALLGILGEQQTDPEPTDAGLGGAVTDPYDAHSYQGLTK